MLILQGRKLNRVIQLLMLSIRERNMNKNTVIVNVKFDATKGSHPNHKTQPIGGYKFSYRDDNDGLQILEIKQGLNQHISQEIWNKVKDAPFTQELIEYKVLEVIPEQEQVDKTDELSIYENLNHVKKVISNQFNLETLKLWSRGTKKETVKRFLENHISSLEGGRLRAV